MPEYLRSLVVILVLSTSIFLAAKPTAVLFSSINDFNRRRNLWLTLTVLVFISHSFWIYIIFTGLLLLVTAAHEENKVALFFFLLFVMTPLKAEIPAYGLINFIFTIDHIRLLELVILFPAFINTFQNQIIHRFKQTLPDKIFIAYLVWSIFVLMLLTTLTNTLREIFYVFIDIFLPFYVFSRATKNAKDLRDALFAFLMAATVLAVLGMFEISKKWLLYNTLRELFGFPPGLVDYLMREGGLRASASTGHTLVLGYILAIALGFFFYARTSITSRIVQCIWLALLIGGLISTQSRGPWLGAIVVYLVFLVTGPQAGKQMINLSIGGIVAIPALLISSVGEKFISYLPFVGTVDQFNVTYRQRLIDISTNLLLQNPIFGVPNVMARPEMQEMVQGEGIVDLVNTYIGVGMGSGLVGLALFVTVFISIGFGIFKALRRAADIDHDLYMIGRVLLSSLIGILFIIGTLSSIWSVPVIYWSVAGLGLAYIQIVKRRNGEKVI